jgi:hypothetical protein
MFGVESYAIVQLVALVLFAGLSAILLRRSRIPLRHAAALTLLYLLCNFLAAKLLFDFVKAGGRHTLFDHPALAHFLEGGFWGWPIAFFPCVLAYPFAFRVPPAEFYRAIAFLLPPVFSVQKVACFLAGCCFGRETSLPWAIGVPGRLALRARRGFGRCPAPRRGTKALAPLIAPGRRLMRFVVQSLGRCNSSCELLLV